MKVGMIGLGRMERVCPVVSLLLVMKFMDLETMFRKPEAQYEAGYISGYTTSVEKALFK